MSDKCDFTELVLRWRKRAEKKRREAARYDGTTTGMKAVATALAYESAATELEQMILQKDKDQS